MPRLQNLNVEFVSLVDKAAVRDPKNPTQPQKFLLWKAESGAPEPQPEPEAPTMARHTIRKMEDEIEEFGKLRKRDDLHYYDRVKMRKGAIDAELEYLDEISPAAADVYRQHHGAGGLGDGIEIAALAKANAARDVGSHEKMPRLDVSDGNVSDHQDPPVSLDDESDEIMSRNVSPRSEDGRKTGQQVSRYHELLALGRRRAA